MKKFCLLFSAVILALCILSGCTGSRILAGIFPDWVQYRHTPYKFTAEDLHGVIGRLDHIKFEYAHFSPESYEVKFQYDADTSLDILIKYKQYHPKLKILLSVGGENFPSSYFSEMVASNQSIALFVSNLKAFLDKHGFDGVDISWKWPCSASKTIFRRHCKEEWRKCDDFQLLYDKGSRCSDDSTRLLYLMQELRERLGNSTLITITGPHEAKLAQSLSLKLYSWYIDYFYVESFGYSVSSTNSSYLTAPVAPLNPPSINTPGGSPGSINTTGMCWSVGLGK